MPMAFALIARYRVNQICADKSRDPINLGFVLDVP